MNHADIQLGDIVTPAAQPLKYQINVSLDPRRDIESWCIAQLPEDINRYEWRLRTAHSHVADMFIQAVPLFFYISDTATLDRKGTVAAGVRLVKRDSLPDASPCIMVNRTFWTDCPDKGSLFENLNHISGLFLGMPSEEVMEWCNAKSLHFVEVAV